MRGIADAGARCAADRRAFYRDRPRAGDFRAGPTRRTGVVAAVEKRADAPNQRRTGAPDPRLSRVLRPCGWRCRPKRWSRGRIPKRWSKPCCPLSGDCRAGRSLPHPRSRHRHRRDCAGASRRSREATATGVDISADALATARRNAETLGLGARFTACNPTGFGKISGPFHVIAANPPYIPTNELVTLQSEVRDFDPAKALDGGADGLDAYRAIASQAGAYLETAGRIAVEIGHDAEERRDRIVSCRSGLSVRRSKKRSCRT